MSLIRNNKKIAYVSKILPVLLWISYLLRSNSYFINYLLIAIVFAFCLAFRLAYDKGILLSKSVKNKEIAKTRKIICFFSFLFSGMISFSNYDIWNFPNVSNNMYAARIFAILLLLSIFLAGGYIAFSVILSAVFLGMDCLIWRKATKSYSPKIVFVFSFGILSFWYLVILYFCFYPGNLSNDTYSQITQIITGNYSNQHPILHTMIIRFFFWVGSKFSTDINLSIGLYSVFQILFMAFCFSFAISSLSHLNVPGWIQTLILLFYVSMPYHILYSITLWKDVMFGGFVLLFIVALLRVLCKVGNNVTNYILLVFSGFGFCLFRSNGLFAFVFVCVIFLFLYRFKEKKVLLIMLSAVILSLIFKHAILANLNVSTADTVESLSIPVQQVSRVVSEGYRLSEYEYNVLSEVVDVEQIAERYDPYISDPIKNLVREHGTQEVLTNNKIEYLKVYLLLGVKHPASYIRGWIDETKGYWNSGYDYWRWSYWIEDNDLGIQRTVRSERFKDVMLRFFGLFNDIQLLRVFISIGLFVWIDLGMSFISIIRKDKTGLLLTVPILTIVLSLLVATPVFAEFRYLYAAFCSLPFVVMVCLRPVSSGDAE